MFCICCLCANAETLSYRSQTSSWITSNKNNQHLGFRFIPELSYNSTLSKTYEFSVEAAGQARWLNQFKNLNYKDNTTNIDPYRLWLRLSAPQHEFRLGLQKLNFGSATLFRPLRWFDSVDPRDPLKLTEGVYGLMGRYYFLNNTNIWLWALAENDKLKGWEELPSNKHRFEFGGRVQIPVQAGEVALSFHQRRVNVDGTQISPFFPAQGDFSEQVIGFDGKWDLGVGLWFESTVARQEFRNPEARYKTLITLGTDYTFDVGQGFHLLFEEFMSIEARHPFSSGKTRFMSGLSGDYPINLLDSVSAVVYYDQEQDDWSRYIAWQRTYDHWQIHLSAFWNPEQKTLAQADANLNSLSGTGLQVMLVFTN